MFKAGLMLTTWLLCASWSLSAQAQQQEEIRGILPVPACPTIALTGPSETVPLGGPATVSVSVHGGDPNLKLTFAWSVSAGTITTGQGTTAITIDTVGLPIQMQPLTVTLSVGGLEPTCINSAAIDLQISPACILFPKFDEYGKLKLSDEHARLDNFANDLQAHADASAYVITYGGRRGPAGEAARRADRAKNYLINNRRIAAGRVVTIDGGYREEPTTELWLVPPDAGLPIASPTVDPSDVQIIEQPRRKRPNS